MKNLTCVRAAMSAQLLADRIGKTLLILSVLISGSEAQDAIAETQQLRARGRTLVEAEGYSAVSDKFPYAQPSDRCSGKSYLGYYWGNSWFELQVEVPQMHNYGISLRTASEKGTQIEVQWVSELGEKTLAMIDVASTGSWTEYTHTKNVILSLPSGVRTLRFKNLVDGANIDFVTFTAGADDDVVTVRPVATAGPDINPLKGFSSGWWRNEEYASVGFQYVEWGQFEPEDDVFDWDYVEKEVLNRLGTQGRHFIMQFVVDWDYREPVEDNYLGPAWLRPRVGEHLGNADPDDSNSRKMRATRYNDPVFIDEAKEAIKVLLDRYRDDPRNYVIQVGLLGFWGEWHTFPRQDWTPTNDTKSSILDAYMKNLGIEGLTQVRYPRDEVTTPRMRMGYTNGSATLTDHGYEFGRAIAERELWKNGPVGGEWPPNVEDKLWERFFLTEEGESFIKQARYSTLLPPEPKEIASKLPGWKQDEGFMTMHRQMGYNFQAKAVRHLVAVDASGETHIEVELHNSGIAPFYKKWDVQLAVLKAETSEVVELIKVDTDLRTLGPDETITIPGISRVKLDPDIQYKIGLRILQPHADKTKTTAWNLKARNVYVVLANDLEVMEGKWGENNVLQGGWNILDVIQRREPAPAQSVDGGAFPFQGSFRPTVAP